MSAGDSSRAVELIDGLGLRPHPEGGWYAETWRAPAAGGERAASTAIHFLLRAGERSHWHRVDADEIWLHHDGGPLRLSIADGDGRVARFLLGRELSAGERAQVVVPAGSWQSAEPLGEWVLVSCVVAPAFDFDGFELAPDGWEPGRPADGDDPA